MEFIFDAGTNTWMAFSEETLVSGFGADVATALDHLLDNTRDQYCRFLELGEARVSPSSWRTLPALREALGVNHA